MQKKLDRLCGNLFCTARAKPKGLGQAQASLPTLFVPITSESVRGPGRSVKRYTSFRRGHQQKTTTSDQDTGDASLLLQRLRFQGLQLLRLELAQKSV